MGNTINKIQLWETVQANQTTQFLPELSCKEKGGAKEE